MRDYSPQHKPRENPGEPDPPRDLGLLEQNNTIGASNNNSRNEPRFVISDIGFLNLFYNNKSINTILEIEYTSKDTYFRDIIIFINYIKDIARSKVELLRNNL